MISKKLFVVSLVSAVVLTWIACGGGMQSSTPSPNSTSAKAHSLVGLIAGMHILPNAPNVARDWSLVPKAYAQGSGVALAQSWNGTCLDADFSQDTGATAPVSMPVFGLGHQTFLDATEESQAQACVGLWNDNDATGQQAVGGAPNGQLVVGNGTMGNLVAYTNPGTTIASSGGNVIHLWVNRGGSVVDTTIGCTLPAGSGFIKCSSGNTFAAQDGDLAIATVANLGAGDKLVNLNVVFTKTVP